MDKYDYWETAPVWLACRSQSSYKDVLWVTLYWLSPYDRTVKLETHKTQRITANITIPVLKKSSTSLMLIYMGKPIGMLAVSIYHGTTFTNLTEQQYTYAIQDKR